MLLFTIEDLKHNEDIIFDYALSGETVVINCGDEDVYLVPRATIDKIFERT